MSDLTKEFSDSLIATGYSEDMARKIAEQMFGQSTEEGK